MSSTDSRLCFVGFEFDIGLMHAQRLLTSGTVNSRNGVRVRVLKLRIRKSQSRHLIDLSYSSCHHLQKKAGSITVRLTIARSLAVHGDVTRSSIGVADVPRTRPRTGSRYTED